METPSLSDEAYADAIARRRAFSIEGYQTLGELEFDGEWVTPLQMAAGSRTGPVLIALHWLDVKAVHDHREMLLEKGYLPSINFNLVLDRALALSGLHRSEVYLTQAFHLLPELRSQSIPLKHLRKSFNAVTRYEIAGRPVIALGGAASSVCQEEGVPCVATLHPSARGLSFEARAARIAAAITSTAPASV